VGENLSRAICRIDFAEILLFHVRGSNKQVMQKQMDYKDYDEKNQDLVCLAKIPYLGELVPGGLPISLTVAVEFGGIVL
jgi:hypothetical protein